MTSYQETNTKLADDVGDDIEDKEKNEMGEMRAFRLIVEYDGSNYCGWQCQPNQPSIQQSLEEALEYVTCHPVRCYGAGRTDSGVHAMGQVVRVMTTAPNIDEQALVRGGNTNLPEDIRIQEAQPCNLSFDPRREARMRWYRYSMINQPVAPALDRKRYLHLPGEIDWNAVDQAIQLLKGEHDFSAFRSSACSAKRTVLTMETAHHLDAHPIHHFDFKCRSFLHHMVRFMSGMLIEIGMGKQRISELEEMLRTGKRRLSFRLAPAHGLVLMRVLYEKDLTKADT
ncbi:MAG: tRNA pseudouridine(38-40) synthase TruA [Candidatus Sumerlaeia bacterium]